MGTFKSWWEGEKDPFSKSDLKTAPINTPSPTYNTAPQPPQGFYAVGPSFGQTQLDQEQHQKWSKFFTDLVDSSSTGPYKQLIVMTGAMGNIPPQTSFPTVFAGLHAAGTTKEALKAAAQATIDSLVQNAKDYASKKELQRQDVERLRKQASDKQLEIQKLQQEINDLNKNAMEAEQKINTNLLGYNTYSAQALAKVGSDLQSISNFIPD